MASYINRGETLLIPFENGRSICDSQLRPRMYKTMQALDKTLPKHFRDTYNVEVVEYVEVKHGKWIAVPSSDMSTGKAYKCSECGKFRYGCRLPPYCQECGAKMDGKKE